MKKQQMGLVGLAVMGQNLALNMANKGFSVAVYNRTTTRTAEFMAAGAKNKDIVGATTIEEFVEALEKPRKIMMMVKAGGPVDTVIQQLRAHLSKGDLLIDGGNSFYRDTIRRSEELAQGGFLYIGTGVSGGEEGALKGPCIMPGGQQDAYKLVAPVLTRIAAQTEDGACCAYIGPGGAGHFVKMVHNGIEYGIMQLIAETYDIMKSLLGMEAQEMSEVFGEWNQHELDSYLVEITRAVLAKVDEETGGPIVDVILDKAGQKGTGKWTTQEALDVGVPTPTINAAVEARILSAYKGERLAAAKVLQGPDPTFAGDKDEFVEGLRQALFASVITSYAQGFVLMSAASREYGFELNLAEIARIWKGGCIIRARLLDPMRSAFTRRPDLPNLMVDDHFCQLLNSRQDAWRKVVKVAVENGVPCLAMSASLAYFDSYRQERLPANVTQGQRDYFGAHTYQRLDKQGTFHTNWLT